MTDFYTRNELAQRAATHDFFATRPQKADATDPVLDSARYLRIAEFERSKAALALFGAIGRGFKRGFIATRDGFKRGFIATRDGFKRGFEPLTPEQARNLPPEYYYYYYYGV